MNSEKELSSAIVSDLIGAFVKGARELRFPLLSQFSDQEIADAGIDAYYRFAKTSKGKASIAETGFACTNDQVLEYLETELQHRGYLPKPPQQIPRS